MPLCKINRFFLIALVLLLLSQTSCRAIKTGRVPAAEPHQDAGFYREYSRILGYSLSGTEDPGLLREVSSWLGTPHRMGGISRQGADCSGFVGEVFRAVYGIQLPRTSTAMALSTREIPQSQLREGDLVFFITRKGAKINHVGIYLSNGRFIHVSSTRGVIVSQLSEPFFVRTFYKAGRVR